MTNQLNKVKIMTIAGLLCALGIMIPMVFPRIIIGPASFTLASHVPIFIAMFISPVVAVSVAMITSFGFLFAGFPIIIVLRAFSHLIFVALGAFILKKNGNLLNSFKTITLFSLAVSLVHAAAEVVVVTYFYFGNQVSEAFYENGYVMSVLGLIGVGGLIHSMVDFTIAAIVWKTIQNVISLPASARIRVK